MSSSTEQPTNADTSISEEPSPSRWSVMKSERTRRQAGLFFGGVAFTVFSAIVTRRAIVRRNAPSTLSSFTPPGTVAQGTKGSPPSSAAVGYKPAATEAGAGAAAGEAGAAADAAAQPDLYNSGPMVAIEALALASMNTLSWAMMAVGGALWYFDISNMEELRRKIRGGMGVDGTGRTEQEAEEEIEEWVATVLSRKEEKLQARGGKQVEWKNERGSQR